MFRCTPVRHPNKRSERNGRSQKHRNHCTGHPHFSCGCLGRSLEFRPSFVDSVRAITLRCWKRSGQGKCGVWPCQLTPRTLVNPLQVTGENMGTGCRTGQTIALFAMPNDGSGNTEIGRNLYPKALDMRQRQAQELTDGELYYSIQNGVRLTGMPAWGSPQDGDNNQDSWKLVLFIRHLPHLTTEEEKEQPRLRAEPTLNRRTNNGRN